MNAFLHMAVLRRLAVLAFSSTVAFAAVAQPTQPVALAAAQAQISPLFDAMLAAAQARDAERHMAAYAKSPALVFIYNDAKLTGFEAVLAMTRQAFAPGSDLAFQLVGEPA
jgi:hypothetical protein